MNIKDFKKCDSAYLFDYRHNKLKEIKIDSVGRTYVHIGYEKFKEHPYYPECLTNTVSDDLLFKSITDYEDYKEHNRLKKELHDAFDWFEVRRIPLSKLRKIKEILEGDET